MKDKSLVIIIVGVTIILGLGIGEQVYLSNFSKDKYKEVDNIHSLVCSGNIEESEEKIKNMVLNWEEDRKILEIMINHDDIKMITTIFKEIEDNFKNFFDSRDISAKFAELKEYIINMDRENKFTLTNVL